MRGVKKTWNTPGVVQFIHYNCFVMSHIRLVALLTVLWTAVAASYSQTSADVEYMNQERAVPADTLPSFEPPASTLPREGHRETVGLVLSGGGAKGIAHVGIIKAPMLLDLSPLLLLIFSLYLVHLLF